MLITEIFEPNKHHWNILNEAEGKNTHLEHVEDLIFNEGYKGALRAFDYLDAVKGLLRSM